MIDSTHIVKTLASLILALLWSKQNSSASNISLQVLGPPSNDRSSLKYNLYTRENPGQPCILEETLSSLKECPLDPILETIIIISGFQDKLPPEDLFFKKASIDVQKVHIIGMSLGSHVAGNAGRKVPNLGRITAIEPAGPEYIFNKISYRDASFVQAIHTSSFEKALQFGLSKPVGHMDFYINGGITQPQCYYGATFQDTSGKYEKVTGIPEYLGCNHVIAVSYFLETINSTDCHFIGTLCKSYDDFKKGTCDAKNTVVAEMGFQGRQLLGLPPNSKFYLRTNLNSPYCLLDGYVPGKFPDT